MRKMRKMKNLMKLIIVFKKMNYKQNLRKILKKRQKKMMTKNTMMMKSLSPDLNGTTFSSATNSPTP